MDGSDQELVTAAAGGNVRAFHALLDRHAKALFQLAQSLAPSRADAEDICQETFVAAFVGLGGFNGRSTIKTWLTSILLRHAAKHWRRSQRVKNASLQTAAASRELAAPEAGLDRKIDVLNVISSLGPEHQQVVVLREIEGMSYQEIAEVLNVPRGTVESRLHRARAELRLRLKDYA